MGKNIGKIERLHLQETVDPMLAAKRELAEIVSEVERKHGVKLTDSSVSRYKVNVFDSRVAKLERTRALFERMDQTMKAHPDTNFVEAGMSLVIGDTVASFADDPDAFKDADKLEVGTLFYKMAKLQLEREQAKSAAQQIDRQALYLEFLKEFTDYLTAKAPSALTALGETFDGFLDQVKAKHAPAH